MVAAPVKYYLPSSVITENILNQSVYAVLSEIRAHLKYFFCEGEESEHSNCFDTELSQNDNTHSMNEVDILIN